MFFTRIDAKIILFMGFMLVLAPGSLFACLCEGTATVDEEFKTATAVFAGKFIGSEYRKGIKNEMVETHNEISGGKRDYEMLVYKFMAKTWWKGAGTREVILISDHARMSDGSEVISDCGLGFETGREYLIYAFGSGNDFGTGACTRTRRISRARIDINRLNRLATSRP